MLLPSSGQIAPREIKVAGKSQRNLTFSMPMKGWQNSMSLDSLRFTRHLFAQHASQSNARVHGHVGNRLRGAEFVGLESIVSRTQKSQCTH